MSDILELLRYLGEFLENGMSDNFVIRNQEF